jgi:hypothetical protein
MTIILFLALIGIGDALPKDAEIAARIQVAIVNMIKPDNAFVTVKRNGNLSTTFEKIEIVVDNAVIGKKQTEALNTMSKNSQPAGEGRNIKVKELVIRGEEITIGDIAVSHIDFNAANLDINVLDANTGNFKLNSAGECQAEVVLTEGAICAYLRSAGLPINDPSVRISPNQISVTGTTKTAFGLPVSVTGMLRIRNGETLYLENPIIRVTGFSVPSIFIKNSILPKLNNIVNINTALIMPVKINITKLQQLDGKIMVTAEPVIKKE